MFPWHNRRGQTFALAKVRNGMGRVGIFEPTCALWTLHSGLTCITFFLYICLSVTWQKLMDQSCQRHSLLLQSKVVAPPMQPMNQLKSWTKLTKMCWRTRTRKRRRTCTKLKRPPSGRGLIIRISKTNYRSGSKVTWLKPSLKVMILTGVLISTSSCFIYLCIFTSQFQNFYTHYNMFQLWLGFPVLSYIQMCVISWCNKDVLHRSALGARKQGCMYI